MNKHQYINTICQILRKAQSSAESIFKVSTSSISADSIGLGEPATATSHWVAAQLREHSYRIRMYINSVTLFKYVSIYLSTCFIDNFIVAMCSEISYMFKRCPVLARQHGNSFRGKIEESRLCPELDSFRRQLWGDSSFTMPKALAPRHSDLCFASLKDQPL